MARIPFVFLIKRDAQGELADFARAQGGVRVIALDEYETVILKPVVKDPGEPVGPNEARVTQEQYDAMTHFRHRGIRVSSALNDITDIINLPKPPGRHGIMSNCGVTGAVKNYIGLLSGVGRTEDLHNPYARTPPRREGESITDFQDRNARFVEMLGSRGVSARDVEAQRPVPEYDSTDDSGLGDWRAHEEDLLRTAEEWVLHMSSEAQKLAGESGNEADGPGQGFFEKLAELNLMFRDRERFAFTDMRQAVSSFGPDFGEKMDVGKAIASDKSAVVDAIASGELKRAYERQAPARFDDSEFHELDGGTGIAAALFARVRDAMSSGYQLAQDRHFLRKGDPFRLKSYAASMRIPGLAPPDMRQVALKTAPREVVDSPFLGRRGVR